jgi:hypothetical protein
MASSQKQKKDSLSRKGFLTKAATAMTGAVFAGKGVEALAGEAEPKQDELYYRVMAMGADPGTMTYEQMLDYVRKGS